MNFEFFIANRIVKSKTAAKKISRPVIRISVGAIALGIIIMIVAMATGNGLRKEIRNKVIGFSGHIQILNYQPNPTYEQTPTDLPDSVLTHISGISGVEYIQPFAQKAGIIKTDSLFEGALLKGVNADYHWQNLAGYITEGKAPTIGQTGYNDSILISRAIADKLSLTLNDKFSMYFVREAPKPPLLRNFYISGIYQTDFEEIDNNFLIGDIKHLQRLNKWDSTEVGGYEIFLKNDDNITATNEQIRLLLPYDLDALSARQLNEQLFQWLDLFDLNIMIIIIIMIAVATINMSIALLILILERTQMVGILKALGSANGSIRRIFLINATYLILRGLFWGNLIGIGLCLLQQQFGFVKLDPTTYYVSEVSIDLNIPFLLALNGITVLICLICLILPSYLITRISPVKAIRFD
ncbi:ABC-type transport system, involved in lipoprotein release, permease component [Owenweeksia hongkongensis DSM 17368]|uniref:ABC-type transport system, involved in lipoprotein release, permease component n=1 Tax=Owenweeksia hongkongensis (strain DSM 17368 / CIP 108786 / JCM 12287 / NRRL B-23963 / UST20020801) TaxID=926562 RepID=G8R399_OWEHD|nr:FtsX-like permease family protein [Owenweeksia hongkongensis]AEV31920.1 ABC-type transport system, involved in lipoprotein release, permease component [Owenweeksia hongkongensis DSM 17368]